MKYLSIIVCLFLGCSDSSPPYAQEREGSDVSFIKDEASIMIQGCFDVINQIEGIEYFGGPLNLKNYITPNITATGLRTRHYRYSGDRQECPLYSFDFYAVTHTHKKTNDTQIAPPLDEQYTIAGDFSDTEKIQILSVFRDFCAQKDSCGCDKIHEAKYAFYTNKNVLIQKRTAFGLCGLYRKNKNSCFITFDETVGWGFLRTHPDNVESYFKLYEKFGKYLPISGHGQHLLFKKKNNKWSPLCFVDYDTNKVIKDFIYHTEYKIDEDCIELQGDLSKEEVLSFITIASKMCLFDDAIDLIQQENDLVSVSSGSHKKRPQNGVLLTYQNSNWNIERYCYILNLDLDGLARDHLPLLEKPSAEEIKGSILNLHVPNGLTDNEVTQICELILRVPNVDHRLMSIKCEEDGYIWVKTGKQLAPLAGSGNYIKLKRKGNLWVILNVIRWVS